MKAKVRMWAWVAILSVCTLCRCSVDASAQCERLRQAIEDRTVECASDWVIVGNCDEADYIEDDKAVGACLDAVRASSCEELRQTVRDECAGLFGKVAL